MFCSDRSTLPPRIWMGNFLCVLLCFVASPGPLVADENEKHAQFLRKYCVSCHGATEPKAGVRLDKISEIDSGLWRDVYEQLAGKTMPPDDRPQPTGGERRSLQEFALKLATKDPPSTGTGLRRLNKREYANTVRDLLGLHDGTFDPGAYIYDDEIDEGFDTRADALVISNELLMEYMNAAKKSLQQALFSLDREKPSAKAVEVPIARMQGVGGSRYINRSRDHIICRSGGKAKVHDGPSSRTIDTPGRYTITVTAAGVDRDTYPIRLAPEKGPLVMGFGVAPDSVSSVSSDDQLLKTFPLEDSVEQTFQFDAWIDQGHYPYFSFVNGSSKPITQIRSNIRRRKIPASAMSEAYKGPGIRITKFKIEGPHHDQWPATSIRTTIDADQMPDLNSESQRRELLERFAKRAFRRPVTREELSPYLDYLHQQYESTGRWRESIIRTFAAMMSSVDFLYLQAVESELDAYALASRLSYFFWSTMPDEELFQLAKTDRLRNPSVLRDQVRRLLRDPRSEQFSTSFAQQWLALDKLGTMPPDAKGEFRAYYRQGLETAMLEETHRYFRYVLDENCSVRDFLDSDYSFVNKSLADLYRIPFPGEDRKGFVRVTFPTNSPRGGLLGQASILTLSANGVETSPIERGVWVLSDLLGTPPPPPPKAVPALTPDLNGAVTIRDMLEKHRSDPACRECHRRMDPLGFALEAFDPIGQHRTKYSKTQTVSTNGNYLGQEFSDVTELRRILAENLRPFARSLVIRIAEYAKGRELVATDYATVDAILSETEEQGFQLNDMIQLIATSDLMTNK